MQNVIIARRAAFQPFHRKKDQESAKTGNRKKNCSSGQATGLIVLFPHCLCFSNVLSLYVFTTIKGDILKRIIASSWHPQFQCPCQGLPHPACLDSLVTGDSVPPGQPVQSLDAVDLPSD